MNLLCIFKMLGPSMTLPETLKLPQACLIYKVVGLLLALPENLHFKSNKQVEEHRYIYPEVSGSNRRSSEVFFDNVFKRFYFPKIWGLTFRSWQDLYQRQNSAVDKGPTRIEMSGPQCFGYLHFGHFSQ